MFNIRNVYCECGIQAICIKQFSNLILYLIEYLWKMYVSREEIDISITI